MKPRSNDAELKIAVSIVAHHENVSTEFILATQTPSQIFRACRRINRKHEKEMDAIRSEW